MDLICYTMPGWEPRLRAAARERAWMDEAPERFAYRCLPLAIANAHGWEVLSPCGFSARWDGRPGADGVEILVDAGVEPRRHPVSLFGLGTLTFHVEGIFRTPAGWNLWIGPPPNAAKDAIAALTGVIETDWSPYSFTMNWRFTRPHHWVRFEENEPIAFLMPVQRAALEQVQPRVLDASREPGLVEAFGAWSRSRDAFQAAVAANPPAAPADKWQKLYYRGLCPDGTPGAPDHLSKLRVKPFRDATGRPVEPPAVVARKPAVLPARATGGHVVTASALSLPARPSAMGLGQPAYVPAAAEPAPADTASALALRRRDWIMRLIERQRELAPHSADIPRLRDLPSADFLRSFYAASRPVVLEAAAAHWPAIRRWTPDYLANTVGDAVVEYQGGRESAEDFELAKDRHLARAPFRTFMEAIRRPGNDAYLTAYNSDANREALAPLQQDLGRLDRYLTDEPGMLWLGPAGTFTPLHFDLTNNLLVQLVGAKRLLLIPPAEAGRLAHHRHVFSEVRDLEDEERLAAYPDARAARRFEVTLGPGDALYIPVGWFHQVRSLSFSAMLTYTSFIWRNDGWESFPADT